MVGRENGERGKGGRTCSSHTALYWYRPLVICAWLVHEYRPMLALLARSSRWNTTRATAAPVHADFTDTAPVTSSRPAVRGLRASISRSMMRLAAIANVRSPTMATVTSSSVPQWMSLSSWNIAVSAAMYAKGSAKTECSIITSRRKARGLLRG